LKAELGKSRASQMRQFLLFAKSRVFCAFCQKLGKFATHTKEGM